jgi:predicted RNA-binding protein with RPS1 domain
MVVSEYRREESGLVHISQLKAGFASEDVNEVVKLQPASLL